MTAGDVAKPGGPIGRIVITWPAPTGGVLAAMKTVITDADTGQPIPTVTKVVIADVDEGVIYADMRVLCDPDGRPYLNNVRQVVAQADGTIRQETFRFVVAEMRVAAPEWTPGNAKPVAFGEHGPEWPHP